ncbi:MAG: DUF4411 family protein [Alphaproteobacteria bacterium GM202ARS2]|nr:DUF4411 family protein [Alphaproteobacteria bacterium GM202ARS2]
MSGEFCIDSNCLMTYWKDFPRSEYPNLWEQLGHHAGKIVLLNIIKGEIKGRKKLHDYIKNKKFIIDKLTPEAKQPLLQWENIYEPDMDKSGCGEKDLRLIAYAKHHRLTVVTEEKVQDENPSRKERNYNIPSVCRKENVKCINFNDLLEKLGIKIE